LAALKTDGPVTGNITGHAIFTSSEYSVTQLPSYCTFS